MVDTIVVGGGPGGMMAAYAAHQKGERVLLLEQNDRLGKKLLITGKGRCNITNQADMGDFISQVPVNASFLYSAFYSFTNQQLLELLHQYGLETKVERGGRVFPVSDRSSDVLKTLLNLLKGVEIRTGVRVRSVETEQGRVSGVVCYDRQKIAARKVILATGGVSYPMTGSRGDGYGMAERLGHSIVPPKASLVPLETAEAWCSDLQGLALKNVSIRVTDPKGKELYSDFGEMLFTHFGVSGPVILSASSHMKQVEHCRLEIDLKPALTEEQMDQRLLRDFQENSNRDFCNALDGLFPKKLIPVMVSLSGILPHTKVNQLTREQRLKPRELCKHLTCTLTAKRPVEEAIITSGGVSVREINPSTMESKQVPGLYFCGELIDVDAYTGGYNLQIAFSTGYLAGQS